MLSASITQVMRMASTLIVALAQILTG